MTRPIKMTWCATLVLVTACTANVSGPTTTRPVTPGVPPAVLTAAPAHIRRLTAREFDNTVLDVFGDSSQPASSFPTDGTATGFDNDFASLAVDELFAEHLQAAAESVAGGVVTRLGSLLPCAAATPVDEPGCVGQFITTFGKKLYRRPVTAAEQTGLLGVFTQARGLTDFKGAVQTVAESLLQSPAFLYRTELGDGQGMLSLLAPYELASELSYLLWVSAPDDALFAAAESGALKDAAGVAAQVQRMLKDPRSKRGVDAFFEQWLELTNPLAFQKSNTLFPSFTTQVAQSTVGETRAFVEDVFFNGDATLTSLFTAPRTFVNADVAPLYGLSNVAPGSSYVAVALDPKQRAGLFTQPSFIAAHTHADDTAPVRAGKFFLTKVLCEQISPPPNNVPKVQPPDPNVSTRARYTQHSQDPACSGCHLRMDPIGFGLEQYDPVGHFQTMESGKFPLTGAGVLKGTDVDGTFQGGVQLAQRLAGSKQVAQCFAHTFFQYALGRPTVVAQDAASLQTVDARFLANNLSVRELLAAIAQSDAFLYRQN